ncbi:MAG TPA: PEP-CTERM sorting domain-containing protein, partial [Bryobacteraceae bacterium]|nr:PEP-CTERM sorting domain-containing protein [Bryobacteraceae bacterium]
LARVTPGGVVPATISAFMDPLISLDSSDPSGLSLVFSQGVTQGLGAPAGSTGIPEPSSLSLVMGAGLAGLLALRLRR